MSSLVKISQFLRKHPELTECAFGKKAVNDGSLIRRMRNGCDLEQRTKTRIDTFMTEYGK